ncbi:MAG: hypothetical protein [Wendovervirus sonii]|uniref:Uncharacterized protein n=1 Tax=phage Lak_Megaphage_Sonny TaxID=3109229 RepID=A0ABZ0Z3G6_9CAUD|nr:MAG: hypothetical protein [phage Lak_Megaphage_Sonny]
MEDLSIKWKILIAIVASALFIVLSLYIIHIYSQYDTEYLGHYIVRVEYEEPWNEYIHEICTETVHDGYDEDGNEITHTETYDCSHIEEHYPMYYYTREDGDVIIIDESQYRAIIKKLGTKARFVDMHRNYYTKDGNKYVTTFDGNRNKMWTLTEEHKYVNKVKGSKSVFNFSNVSEEDIKQYHLYDYPKGFNYFKDQNPLIGIKTHKEIVDSFKYLNAYYGGKYQFRCYVMVWKDAPLVTSKMEQDYLIGGNKNELIVCISVDSTCHIQWVNAFSWEDTPYISVDVNHLYEPGERLDLMKLNRMLLKEVPLKWKRKEFKDFEYIKH